MKKTPLCFLMVLTTMLLLGCSDDHDEDVPANVIKNLGKISLLVSVNGLGDNGYNDCIAEGIMSFCRNSGTDLSILCPEEIDEARRMFEHWLTTDGMADSSVLVINNIYESFITHENVSALGKGSRILVLEGLREDYPQGVDNVRICRYGASYLCGAMSRKFNAIIMMAMPDYPVLEESKAGFLAGFDKYKSDGLACETICLSNNESGFANPDLAHHILSEKAKDHMIFPLIGGSVVGAVNYLNNDTFALSLLIGMDVDLSHLCSRVPFSLAIHVDSILKEYLDVWKKGEEWNSSIVFGLEQGYLEVVLNSDFNKSLNVGDYRYEEDEFRLYHDIYYQEALEMEKEYLSENV